MEWNLLKPVEDKDLFRMKWDYERERTGYADLLDFGTADMDFKSPEPILSALKQVLERGHLGYPMLPDAYYNAIHDWLVRHCAWDVDTYASVEHNVSIYMAVWNALDALTLPGDKVTIFTPVHFCFKRQIQINGRVAVECPLVEKDGRFTIDPASLEACLADDTKVLWICNPHNPVGRAWTPEELQIMADLCVKYDVLILSDDVYCDLLYPGAVYTPIASLSKEVSQRTMTFYSPSKSYNVTGLRHSFTLTENPEFMKRYRESMDKIDLGYGMTLMGIAATIAAYNECGPWIRELMSLIENNHQMLTERLEDQVPQIRVAKADATYFAWVDMRSLGIAAAQLAYRIEQEEHMIVENGLQLGKGGAGFIRINLSTTPDTLEEGIDRLIHFCQNSH